MLGHRCRIWALLSSIITQVNKHLIAWFLHGRNHGVFVATAHKLPGFELYTHQLHGLEQVV